MIGKGRLGRPFFFRESMRPLQLPLLLALICSLALTVLVYTPGLHGSFLFDDFANLPSLGDSGPIDNWPAFWRYITSGTADPTGRPLALLSFLIDARNWPADPYPFKRTGLLLHLLNGVLLTFLLQGLGRALPLATREPTLGFQRRIDMAAVLGASLAATSSIRFYDPVHRSTRGDATNNIHTDRLIALASRKKRAAAR